MLSKEELYEFYASMTAQENAEDGVKTAEKNNTHVDSAARLGLNPTSVDHEA